MIKEIFRKTLFVLVLALFAVLGGCTEKYDSEYDPDKDPLVNTPEMFEQAPDDLSKIAMDETFIISFRSGPSTANPLFVSSGYDNILMSLVYDGIFEVDTKLNMYHNPNMVESWEETEDHKIITVKLKEGLTWQDGHPLTSADLVFTVDMLKNDKVPCYTFKTEVVNIDKAEAIDELTVKYYLNKPMATRRELVTYPGCPIPKHLFEKDMEANPDLKKGKYYQNLAVNPVGNGPYKIIEWVENDKIVFERWEDYPGPKPYLKRIIYKIVPDVSMALLAFKSGDIDAMYVLLAKQCARETNDEEFAAIGRKYVMPEWIYDYQGWNMDGSNPFFLDKKVRRALAHAYNFDLIKTKLYYNLITKCNGNYHPTSWMFNDKVDPINYDLEKAAQMLDEAGWMLESDGWRYKDVRYVLVENEEVDELTGDPVTKIRKVFLADDSEYKCKDGEKVKEEKKERRKFEYTYLSTPSNGLPRPSTTVYQTDLRKIGVDMKVRLMEWTSFMDRVLKHDVQSWGAAWGSGTDPDGGKGCWRIIDYDNGRNYGGYANPEVDKLYEEGMLEFDHEKRAEIYRKIHKIIYDDQPYLFASNRLSVSIVHKRMRGMLFNSFGFCSTTAPGFRSLWVPKGEEMRPVKDK